MSKIKDVAMRFFEACEAGKGWEACQEYCHPGATFSVQAPALAEVKTVQGYTDWVKGFYTFIADPRYELKSFAVDEERNNVTTFAVFLGKHTGEGGPVPPTGKSVASEYCYSLQFEGDRIRHMTKIWNDGVAMQQLGWA